MKAFENGADGVIVAGCEEGSCHFKEGNLIAKRRVNYARKLLAESGLEMERLRMVNVSAANAAFTGRPYYRRWSRPFRNWVPARLTRQKTGYNRRYGHDSCRKKKHTRTD